jgi:hypothetical protein
MTLYFKKNNNEESENDTINVNEDKLYEKIVLVTGIVYNLYTIYVIFNLCYLIQS